VLHILLTVISAVLFIYLFLLSFRFVLSWFTPSIFGKPWDLLRAATDPYLSLFYRIRFLRRGNFDFTPIPAIVVLVVACNLVNTLAVSGRITLGFFLAAIVSVAWSGVRVLILFFLVVGVLRVVPILFHAVADSAIWKVVDMIIYPVVSWVARLFRLGPRSGYTQHLLLTLGLLFVLWLLGELIFGQLASFFQSLPV
jgi:YggT family protein